MTYVLPEDDATEWPPGRRDVPAFAAGCPTPEYVVRIGGRAAGCGAFVEDGTYDADRAAEVRAPEPLRHDVLVGTRGGAEADDMPTAAIRTDQAKPAAFPHLVLEGRT